jgi:undecaprenyl-phosphate 4-deoxy-4-formamido-L-arabinose transferase
MVELINLSVVIPCFRSALYLEKIIEKLHLELIKLIGIQIQSFEIVLVVDGSPDDTGIVAESIAAKFPQIRVLHLPENLGQHAAIFFGVRNAKMPWVLTMDDDGQHPSEEISKLLAGLDNQVDVIYGISAFEEHGIFRNLFSRLTKFVFFWIFSSKGARNFSAFRLFRRAVLDGTNPDKFLHGVIDVELHRATSNFKQVAIEMKKRESGISNYDFFSLSRLAIRMVIGYSQKR